MPLSGRTMVVLAATGALARAKTRAATITIRSTNFMRNALGIEWTRTLLGRRARRARIVGRRADARGSSAAEPRESTYVWTLARNFPIAPLVSCVQRKIVSTDTTNESRTAVCDIDP